MQYDGQKPGQKLHMTNSIRRALDYFDKMEKLRPHTEDDMHRLAIIAYHYEGDNDKACRLWKQAAELNPQKWGDMLLFRSCVYAGEPLPTEQKKETLPNERTNVRMVSCPNFAGIAREMKAG